VVPRITLDLFPVVHRPDPGDFGLGARGCQEEREANEGSLHSREKRQREGEREREEITNFNNGATKSTKRTDRAIPRRIGG
jgi:hypothetical protein